MAVLLIVFESCYAFFPEMLRGAANYASIIRVSQRQVYTYISAGVFV